MTNKTVGTKLSESELDFLEVECKKNNVTKGYFLREMYRKGLEKDVLEQAIFSMLKTHKKQIEKNTEERLDRLKSDLLSAVESMLEDMRFQMLRALEQRLEQLESELKDK